MVRYRDRGGEAALISFPHVLHSCGLPLSVSKRGGGFHMNHGCHFFLLPTGRKSIAVVRSTVSAANQSWRWVPALTHTCHMTLPVLVSEPQMPHVHKGEVAHAS